MTDLSTLLGGSDGGEELPKRLYGLVSRAPADETDSMSVIVPSFSVEHSFEVLSGHWMPRAQLPVINDQCLVILDENEDAWVPVWAPRVWET